MIQQQKKDKKKKKKKKIRQHFLMGLLTTYALQETDAESSIFPYYKISDLHVLHESMNVKSNEYIYFLFLFFFLFSFFYRLLVDDMHFKRKNEHIPKSHTHLQSHKYWN